MLFLSEMFAPFSWFDRISYFSDVTRCLTRNNLLRKAVFWLKCRGGVVVRWPEAAGHPPILRQIQETDGCWYSACSLLFIQ